MGRSNAAYFPHKRETGCKQNCDRNRAFWSAVIRSCRGQKAQRCAGPDSHSTHGTACWLSHCVFPGLVWGKIKRQPLRAANEELRMKKPLEDDMAHAAWLPFCSQHKGPARCQAGQSSRLRAKHRRTSLEALPVYVQLGQRRRHCSTRWATSTVRYECQYQFHAPEKKDNTKKQQLSVLTRVKFVHISNKFPFAGYR